MSQPPVVNTHVHIPPNFSAFSSPEDAVAEAAAQGVAALGVSNFFDQQVYSTFATLAEDAGIVPLFGLEFITLDEELAAAGVKVNDPANPGRIYLCGKGIDPFRTKSDLAETIARDIRTGNDERSGVMVERLDAHLREHGVAAGLKTSDIEAEVAQRGGVPAEWVSLQERHIARAVADEIDKLPDSERAATLGALYGGEPNQDPADSVATQGEIRSRLMKSGTPGYAPEVPLDFSDAYRYILEMGGIPTFPILADGAPELSEFEWTPDVLAGHLKARGIFAVELIPNRNRSEIVDRYVTELTAAGIIVMAGTEHNTQERLPLLPHCADGPLSDMARQAFYDATCVVAAHQERTRNGQPGYIGEDGSVVGDVDELRAEGDRLIRAAVGSARRSEPDLLAPKLRGLFATEAGPAIVVTDDAADADLAGAWEVSAAADIAELRESLARYREEHGGDPQLVVAGGALYAIGQPLSVAGRLSGKIAVVTGAAQGFGLGISEHLLAEGATVVLADLNIDLARAEAERLEGQHGEGRARAVAINVSDEASCKEAIAEVVATFGGIDLFVSNAGVLRAESVMTQPVADFDLVTNVNYRGYFLCVRAVAPVMAAQFEADPSRLLDIVEVNSKSGLEGSKRNFAYAGSKFGGIGLTQSFALELIDYGIKVNAVCPGNYLDGPLWTDPERGLFVQYLRAGKVPGAQTIDDVREFYEAKVPMRRGCLPIDLARAIFYLTEQAYETGQALPVTGGQNMLN